MRALYSDITDSIKVTVVPSYLEEQSSPDQSFFTWAYHVRIENKGKQVVQLINRHWLITDGNGLTQHVRGPGVVGEQPVLKPGEAYEYASGTFLHTPSGLMGGSYEMMAESGERLKIKIPTFSLDSPMQVARPN